MGSRRRGCSSRARRGPGRGSSWGSSRPSRRLSRSRRRCCSWPCARRYSRTDRRECVGTRALGRRCQEGWTCKSAGGLAGSRRWRLTSPEGYARCRLCKLLRDESVLSCCGECRWWQSAPCLSSLEVGCLDSTSYIPVYTHVHCPAESDPCLLLCPRAAQQHEGNRCPKMEGGTRDRRGTTHSGPGSHRPAQPGPKRGNPVHFLP